MAVTQSGRLISFEGSEGCGKSTQIGLLAQVLRAAGLTVLTVREPGGTYIGEQLRHLLKYDAQAQNMCAQTELLLFAASRAQLVREVIAPALAAGTWVLCDRFLDSTTVYQGVARQLDAGAVAAVNTFAVGDTLPDLTFILDLPAQTGLLRAQQRSGVAADRMERESLAFFEAVRAGYLQLAEHAVQQAANPVSLSASTAEGAGHVAQQAASSRFVVLDATATVEAIQSEIASTLASRFGVA